MADPNIKSLIEKNGYEYLANGGLEDELYREVADGHPLHCIRVKGVARRGDDILYRILDERNEFTKDDTAYYAGVHLTWVANAPDRPPRPDCEIYHSFTEWNEFTKNPHISASPTALTYTYGTRRILRLTPFT